MYLTSICNKQIVVANKEATFSASYIYDEIFKQQVYGKVFPGEVVVDAGANIGLYSMYAASCGASRIICFEPDPDNGEAFRENSVIHNFKLVSHLIRKGVWDSDGKRDFISFRSKKGSCRFADAENTTRLGTGDASFKMMRLPLTTIDKACEKEPRIDVIKMDIEGAELFALRGAGETIRRHMPRLFAISLYHSPTHSTNIPKLLASFGVTSAEYKTVVTGHKDKILLVERIAERSKAFLGA